MKNKNEFSSKLRVLFSWIVFGVFVWLAMASVNEITEYLGEGVYRTTLTGISDKKTVITGTRDEHRQWHGPVVIEHFGTDNSVSKEEVTMVNGLRHGRSKETYKNGFIYYSCYNMGEWYDCDDPPATGKSLQSPFDLLHTRYPWFVLGLDGFGFEENAIRQFADTLLALIQPNVMEADDFDDVYDDALELLEEDTIFEQITLAHSDLTDMVGVEVLKAYDLRRAVLDQHRLTDEGTYAMLTRLYTGYLQWIEQGFTAADVHAFCDSIDHKIVRYGPLDIEDPLFLDSIDIRFNRALNEMIFGKSDHAAANKSGMHADIYSESLSGAQVSQYAREVLLLKTGVAGPADVALFVASHMQLLIDQADPLRKVLRTFVLPDEKNTAVVVSQFDRIVSPVSVAVSGTVTADGGAPVTERGFVYGQTYNPTLEHAKVDMGSGLGDFNTIIAGLTTGERYYIRTYATNEVGTAYGNQLEVIMETSTAVEMPNVSSLEFSVFPVPASGVLWVSVGDLKGSPASITVLGVTGQVAVRQELASFGQQAVSIDISGVKPGAYFVRLDIDGKTAVRRVVLH